MQPQRSWRLPAAENRQTAPQRQRAHRPRHSSRLPSRQRLQGVNGWKASADKIRFVFEQSEWIELYPQTEQTSGLAAYLVPHSDDAATYTDTFVAALNDDTPKTELTKPEEQGAAWGSFYAHPEVNAPGYYDLIITSGMKPVAMVMVRIYPEGGLSDYDDAKLEQLMNSELSAAIQ